MAKNTGKPSEASFESKLDALGKRAYYYRIKDAAAIRAITGVIGYADETPSDYIIVINGTVEFAEVKSTVDPVRFTMSQMTKGQNAHGVRILAAGGGYNVYIHRLATDQWYCVALSVMQMFKAQGYSSLKWEDLEAFRWEI
jgi:penicillin-binding protein-related factor A (putative recombinase)